MTSTRYLPATTEITCLRCQGLCTEDRSSELVALVCINCGFRFDVQTLLNMFAPSAVVDVSKDAFQSHG